MSLDLSEIPESSLRGTPSLVCQPLEQDRWLFQAVCWTPPVWCGSPSSPATYRTGVGPHWAQWPSEPLLTRIAHPPTLLVLRLCLLECLGRAHSNFHGWNLTEWTYLTHTTVKLANKHSHGHRKIISLYSHCRHLQTLICKRKGSGGKNAEASNSDESSV